MDANGLPLFLARCATPTGVWLGVIGADPALFPNGMLYAEPSMPAEGQGQGQVQGATWATSKYYEVWAGAKDRRTIIAQMRPWLPHSPPPPGALICGRTARGAPLFAGYFNRSFDPSTASFSPGVTEFHSRNFDMLQFGSVGLALAGSTLYVEHSSGRAGGVFCASPCWVLCLFPPGVQPPPIPPLPPMPVTCVPVLPPSVQQEAHESSSVGYMYYPIAPYPAGGVWGWGVGPVCHGVVWDPNGCTFKDGQGQAVELGVQDGGAGPGAGTIDSIAWVDDSKADDGWVYEGGGGGLFGGDAGATEWFGSDSGGGGGWGDSGGGGGDYGGGGGDSGGGGGDGGGGGGGGD